MKQIEKFPVELGSYFKIKFSLQICLLRKEKLEF